MLHDVRIVNEINKLLELKGFNDLVIDAEMLALIKQNDDKQAKMNAIKEYNRLKSRIKDKLDVRGTLNNFDIVVNIEGNTGKAEVVQPGQVVEGEGIESIESQDGIDKVYTVYGDKKDQKEQNRKKEVAHSPKQDTETPKQTTPKATPETEGTPEQPEADDLPL